MFSHTQKLERKGEEVQGECAMCIYDFITISLLGIIIMHQYF